MTDKLKIETRDLRGDRQWWHQSSSLHRNCANIGASESRISGVSSGDDIKSHEALDAICCRALCFSPSLEATWCSSVCGVRKITRYSLNTEEATKKKVSQTLRTWKTLSLLTILSFRKKRLWVSWRSNNKQNHTRLDRLLTAEFSFSFQTSPHLCVLIQFSLK